MTTISKHKFNNLVILGGISFSLFILPFAYRLVTDEPIGNAYRLHENFIFLILVFLPLQIVLLCISVYILYHTISNWLQDKRIFVKAMLLVFSLPIILWWLYALISLLIT